MTDTQSVASGQSGVSICTDILPISQLKFTSSTSLLDLTTHMIDTGEITTPVDFAQKMMYSLDSTEPFPISIDLLLEWKVYDRKNNTKAKLEKTFILDIDYQVKNSFAKSSAKPKSPSKQGGRPSETIMLSVDCFKSMCMLSNNEIGKQVKRYYLDLEKVFKKYVEFQLCAKEKEIETVKAVKHKELTVSWVNRFDKLQVFYIGYIGIIEDKSSYKFGKSDNLRRRRKEHKETFGQFDLVYVVDCPSNIVLEQRFKEHPCIKKAIFSYKFGEKNQTELFHTDDDLNLEQVEKIVLKLKNEIGSQTEEERRHKEKIMELEVEMHKDDIKAELAKRDIEVERERSRQKEIDLEIARLRIKEMELGYAYSVSPSICGSVSVKSIVEPVSPYVVEPNPQPTYETDDEDSEEESEHTSTKDPEVEENVDIISDPEKEEEIEPHIEVAQVKVPSEPIKPIKKVIVMDDSETEEEDSIDDIKPVSECDIESVPVTADSDTLFEPEMDTKNARYLEIQSKLDTYLLKELRAIGKEIKAKTCQNKKDYCASIKVRLAELMTNTRVCEKCNIALDYDDFRVTEVGLVKKCKQCELKECQKETKYKEFKVSEITPTTKTKQCMRCKKVLSVDDYSKNRTRGDGYEYNCKNCECIRRQGKDNIRLVKKRPDNVKEGHKWCPDCEIVKPVEEFRKATKRPGGLQHSCKICENAARCKRRLANKVKKSGLKPAL